MSRALAKQKARPVATAAARQPPLPGCAIDAGIIVAEPFVARFR